MHSKGKELSFTKLIKAKLFCYLMSESFSENGVFFA